tara:strand:- start:91 stop:408 length:318 start_codon:yes stop_codon:yes gene_type:complete
MTSRLKRNCKMCKKRSNLAFDPEKLLCADCLVKWRDTVIKEHRSGKMTFQDAYESILKRCRINEDELLDLVFPPLGDDDFQNENMAVSLNFDMDLVKRMEELEDE